MYKVMKKEGRKKPKFMFSIGASSPIDAILRTPMFSGMNIIHHTDFVEVIDGNIRYYTEKV